MLTELLEKFEDIFTPHSPEEVEKRMGTYIVGLYSVNNDTMKLTNEYGVARQKVVEVKAPDEHTAPAAAMEKLGIPGSRLQMDRYGPVSGLATWVVELYSEDKITGVYDRPLVGSYFIRVSEKEESNDTR